MAIAGQRAAQPAFKAGTQSARAMGRIARASGAMTNTMVVQRDDGWYRMGWDRVAGREVEIRCEAPQDEEV